MRVYVPRDATALSVGANDVANAVSLYAQQHNKKIELLRNGSRGLLWLEPLLEIETHDEQRLAFGPVSAEDVPDILKVAETPEKHPLFHGPTENIPFLARQDRIIFRRCGITEPLDLQAYAKLGGLEGLKKALDMSSKDIIEEIRRSGLRGRGGAGFPAAIKWETAANQKDSQKYLCCNADEGDSGTFADRMLMEGDPFTLLEGMTIAAKAVGATIGYIYVRSEYPHAIETLKQAINILREHGWLGPSIADSGTAFDIHVHTGAGSYVCGEESAMLNSLEGKRGEVRVKPPIPAISGLFGKPTIVNNVLTLATVPEILRAGSDLCSSLGTERSLGAQAYQLAGDVRQGGLIEKAFGLNLRELIEEFGGGTQSGRPIRAVQIGGPLGAYFSASQLDLSLDYESLLQAGGMLGHGGVVVFNDSVNMAQQARFAMEFCKLESCGKCTPCRIGAARGVETLDKIINNENRTQNLALIQDLCELMEDGSLCAMGGLTPMPVKSAIKQFPEDFGATRKSVL